MAAVVKYFTDYIDWLLHGSRPRPQPPPQPQPPPPTPPLSEESVVGGKHYNYIENVVGKRNAEELQDRSNKTSLNLTEEEFRSTESKDENEYNRQQRVKDFEKNRRVEHFETPSKMRKEMKNLLQGKRRSERIRLKNESEKDGKKKSTKKKKSKSPVKRKYNSRRKIKKSRK